MSEVASKSLFEGDTLTDFPSASREKYLFKGWYLADGTKLTENNIVRGDRTFYAKWEKVKVNAAKAPTLKAAYKVMKVSIPKVSGAKGYQVLYSTSSDMANAKTVNTTTTSATIRDLTPGKKYYIQVRAYELDSAKKKVYGTKSTKKSITMPKFVLNRTKKTKVVGNSYTIKLQGAGGKETFKSSDTSIAKVNSKGKITCLKKGNVTISVSYKGKTYKHQLTVEKPSLNMKTLKILNGQTKTLKLNNTTLPVTFKTANKEIASINSEGVITSKNAGKTNIYAIVDGVKYRCAVSVEIPKISATSIHDIVGNKHQLEISDTTLPIKYASSNEDVAYVNQKGLIYFRKAGVATITCTINGRKYTCEVTVDRPTRNVESLDIIQKHGLFQYKLLNTTLPVTYYSEDDSIATINALGNIRGVKAGTTKVYAKVKGKSYALKVNVKDIHPLQSEIEMNVNDSVEIGLNDDTDFIGWELKDATVNDYNGNFVIENNTLTCKKAGFQTVYANMKDGTKIPIKVKGIGAEGTITNPKTLEKGASNGYKTLIFPTITASRAIGTFTFFYQNNTQISEDQQTLTLTMSVKCNELGSLDYGSWYVKNLFPVLNGNAKFYDSKGNVYNPAVVGTSTLESKITKGSTYVINVTLKFGQPVTENLSMAFFRGNSNVNASLKTVFIKTCIDQAKLDELNAKNQY